MKLHRNSQKRIIFEDAVLPACRQAGFVTSKTYANYPYFRERIFCDLFVENLRTCKQLKGFLLYGWVLNYDHFHLLIEPSDKHNISGVMQFLKRHVSRDINYVMGYDKYDRPSSGGDISECRLQGGTYECYKPIIGEHNCRLKILKSEFIQKYPNKNPYHKFRWQRSFFDEYMRNDNEFDNFLDYISYNPDKHGLPDNWLYVFTNPEFENLTD